jgi:hypothetical protein
MGPVPKPACRAFRAAAMMTSPKPVRENKNAPVGYNQQAHT